MSDFDMIMRELEMSDYNTKTSNTNIINNIMTSYFGNFSVSGCLDFVYSAGGWQVFDR